MAFTLPDLPYEFAALEPHIDAQTMTIHHDKHHAAYVTNLNAAIAGKPEEKLSIEEICKNIFKGFYKREKIIITNKNSLKKIK